MATLSAEEGRDQLMYLWQCAHTHMHSAPALSRTLVHQLLAAAARQEVVLPPRAMNRICVGCCSLLAPGVNCVVTQRSHPRRPPTRRRSLRVACTHCGHVTFASMPPKPSGRSGRAPPPPAPKAAKRAMPSAAPGDGGRSGKRAAAAGPGDGGGAPRKPRPPAPTPAPPASPGDGLFGFDFVKI